MIEQDNAERKQRIVGGVALAAGLLLVGGCVVVAVVTRSAMRTIEALYFFGVLGLAMAVIGGIGLRGAAVAAKRRDVLNQRGIAAPATVLSCTMDESAYPKTYYIVRCSFTPQGGPALECTSRQLGYDPHPCVAEGRVQVIYDPEDAKNNYVDVAGEFKR